MQALSLAFLVLICFSSAQSAITVAQFINDNNVLNYALTLENLEAAYYAAGLAKFGTGDTNYVAAGFPQGTGAAINLIGAQEAGHVASLTAVLGLRGWPAVTACTYNFTSALTSVTTFVNTLSTVENLGTSAYLGAANAITSGDLLTIAAGIATVEARHTAILATITNTSFAAPFPNERDPAFNTQTVLNAVTATGFIVSCNPVTQNVAYSATPVTVSSGTPSSFAFSNSADVRGNNSVADNAVYAATPAGQAAAANDFAVLNYALTLEHLEAYFYQNFTAAFAPAQIQAANPNANATLISQSIDLIRAHEASHVSFLRQVLTTSATNPCSYSFAPLGMPYGSTNFSNFIAAAAKLENTGVSAYVGAIRLIINPFVAALAGTIATVEARHAAYITNVQASIGAIYGPGANVKFDASPIGTQNNNDLPRDPKNVATELTGGGIIFNCPSSNPADIYGLGRTNSQQNFFGDNTDNALAPFPTSSATGTTSTVTTPTPTTSTTTQTRTTGSAGTLSVGFAVIALVAALF